LAIAVLVLINAVFLTVIITDSVADSRSKRLAIENVCSVLNDNGIAVDADDVGEYAALRAMKTTRVFESEEAVARRLLGDVETTGQGAIYRYENAGAGYAEFSSAGVFEVRIEPGVILSGGDARKVADDLLRDMLIDASDIAVLSAPGRDTVTVLCTYKAASIFNCAIEFAFEGGSLTAVTGRYLTGIEAVEDGHVLSSPGTALLAFLSAVRKGDVECAKIESVEAGFQHHESNPYGEGEISPAWLIVADTGRYILDDATGEILSRQMAE